MLKLHVSIPIPDPNRDVELSIEVRYCLLEDCRKAFVPVRDDHRFCSPEHKHRHHNQAKKSRIA